MCNSGKMWVISTPVCSNLTCCEEVKNFGSAEDEAKNMPNERMEAVNVLAQRIKKNDFKSGLGVVQGY